MCIIVTTIKFVSMHFSEDLLYFDLESLWRCDKWNKWNKVCILGFMQNSRITRERLLYVQFRTCSSGNFLEFFCPEVFKMFFGELRINGLVLNSSRVKFLKLSWIRSFVVFNFQALGCLLYEMCALTYPFEASNLVTLYYKIVKGAYTVSISYALIIIKAQLNLDVRVRISGQEMVVF